MRAILRFLSGAGILIAAAGLLSAVAVTPLWWLAVRRPTVYALVIAGLTAVLFLLPTIRKRRKAADHRNR